MWIEEDDEAEREAGDIQMSGEGGGGGGRIILGQAE